MINCLSLSDFLLNDSSQHTDDQTANPTRKFFYGFWPLKIFCGLHFYDQNALSEAPDVIRRWFKPQPSYFRSRHFLTDFLQFHTVAPLHQLRQGSLPMTLVGWGLQYRIMGTCYTPWQGRILIKIDFVLQHSMVVVSDSRFGPCF